MSSARAVTTSPLVDSHSSSTNVKVRDSIEHERDMFASPPLAQAMVRKNEVQEQVTPPEVPESVSTPKQSPDINEDEADVTSI